MRHALDSRTRQIDAFIARLNEPTVSQKISKLCSQGMVPCCCVPSVERSVEIIILDRLSRRAHERVMQFVKSHFKPPEQITIAEAICQLLRAALDIAWSRKYRTFIDGHDAMCKEALTSVYTVRNLSALDWNDLRINLPKGARRLSGPPTASTSARQAGSPDLDEPLPGFQQRRNFGPARLEPGKSRRVRRIAASATTAGRTDPVTEHHEISVILADEHLALGRRACSDNRKSLAGAARLRSTCTASCPRSRAIGRALAEVARRSGTSFGGE